MTRLAPAMVSRVRAAGPDDPVFESLLLLGPLVIAFVAVRGRSPGSQLVAGAYLTAFFGYVLYLGLEPNEGE